MLQENRWIQMRRGKLAFAAGMLLFAGPLLGQEPAPSSVASLLKSPPKLNYARTCVAPAPAPPLAADWAKWDGRDPGIAPDRMLSDAMRLADGDRDVHRDLVLSRKMLTYLASGAGPSASDAKTKLAILLLDANSGPVDPATAARLLTEATAAQRTNAALTMGKLIRDGRLPGMTITDATRYLSISAGLGEPVAALELAAIYAQPGTPLPFPDAAAHFARLAAITVQTGLVSGNCAIAVDVGDHLIEADPAQGATAALSWFEIGANAGDTRALARLARFNETGQGVRERNLSKARDLWDRAIAGGLVRAFVPAAELRINAADDLPTAIKFLGEAMANGEEDGFLLAARYYRGDYTAKADFAAMHKVIDRALQQPDISPALLKIRADALIAGQGIAIDRTAAEDLYRRLLATGGEEGEALFGSYRIDNGLDLADGLQHLVNAAAKGSATARFQQAEIAFCTGAEGGEQLLLDAAGMGSMPATRRLGRLALEQGDTAKAIPLLRKAADAGDRLAMVDLAALVTKGAAIPGVDPENLVRRAALPGAGMIEGRLALASAYAGGRLGDDPSRAESLLATLSEAGRADVAVATARLTLARPGSGDLALTGARLLAAAKGGSADAMYLMTRLPSADPAPDEGWLVQAAQAGSPDALKDLPTTDMTIVEKVLAGLKQRLVCDVPGLVEAARLQRAIGDRDAVKETLRRAEILAGDHPRDLQILAEAFAAPAGENDPAKAATLLQKSAATGHGKSALALAGLYASGRLGERSAEAIGWYRQAAALGQTAGIRELIRYASAQPAAGGDKGADHDISDLAMSALQQLAEHEDIAAMQAYGAILATFEPQRQAEGMAFLEKAAGKDDIQAMKTLARLFAAGLNGTVSAEESTRWTRLAAEKGDPEAMFQYAIALDLGFGVAVDQTLAQTWQQKARQNGFVR